MRDTIDLVQHVTLWNSNSANSSHLRWCGPLHLAFLGDVVSFNKWHKKKKKVTLHILTHGAMWGCGLTLWWIALMTKHVWYKGENCDNKEWDLNYKNPLPRVSGYWRVSDIMEVDVTEFRVYTVKKTHYAICDVSELCSFAMDVW